jgi:hypothetical protein
LKGQRVQQLSPVKAPLLLKYFNARSFLDSLAILSLVKPKPERANRVVGELMQLT